MQVFANKKLNNLFIYGLGQGVNLLMPLLVIPYIIAICGEEGLGKIGIGFSMALIICAFVDYGSYIKGVKDISLNRDDPKFLAEKVKAIYLSKFLLLLLIILVFLIALFNVPYLAGDKLLFTFSLAIVVGQFLNPAWFFQGTENYKWLSFINILSKVLYVTGIFVFVTDKGDYIYANFFFGAGSIIASLIALVFIIKKYSITFENSTFRSAIYILKDEFTFSLSQVFLSVYQYVAIIIIGYLIGEYYAGQYKIIDTVVMTLKSYLTIFFYFIYANICFEISKDLKGGLKVWRLYNGLNFLFVMVVITVFYFAAELILTYFKIRAEDMPVVASYFRISLVIPVLIAISLPLRQLMFAFDKNRVYITVTTVSTIVNVVLLIFLTKHYHLEGAFASIIIIEVIIIALYLLILNNHLKKINEPKAV
jgi:O-antigen/teichoic acid export membrane protein